MFSPYTWDLRWFKPKDFVFQTLKGYKGLEYLPLKSLITGKTEFKRLWMDHNTMTASPDVYCHGSIWEHESSWAYMYARNYASKLSTFFTNGLIFCSPICRSTGTIMTDNNVPCNKLTLDRQNFERWDESFFEPGCLSSRKACRFLPSGCLQASFLTSTQDIEPKAKSSAMHFSLKGNCMCICCLPHELEDLLIRFNGWTQ